MAAERDRIFSLSFFRTSFLMLALGAAASACVGSLNPVTEEKDWTLVDEAQERAMGDEAHAQIMALYGYYNNPHLQEYVSEVGQSMVPHTHRPQFGYRFTVLDTPMVNAFATPGYVYITRGLLALLNSEAELAGVLGHELAHITARHAARQLGQRQTVDLVKVILKRTSGSPLLNSSLDLLGEAHVRGYGRDHELEADRLGARYAALTGYDPHALLQVIRILKDQEAYERVKAAREGREPQTYHGLFSTHPDKDERLLEVIREADKHRVDSPMVRRADYLNHLKGMVVGPAEIEGTLRGRYFYHRIFNFTIALPKGWIHQNHTDRLVSRAPSGGAQLVLTLRSREPGMPACDYLTEKFPEHTLRRPRNTAGFSGCHALVWDGEQHVNVVVAERSDKEFLVLGAQYQSATARHAHSPALESSIQSLRPLKKVEYDTARPAYLELQQVRVGDTYAGLAKDDVWDPDPEAQLRLMNAAYPTGDPTPGEVIKTVR